MDNQTQPTKKAIYKRWWFWVLAVIVLFILIGALSGGGETSQSGSTNNETKAETEKTDYKIGEPVPRGDTTITVNKVTKDWESTNQFDKPTNAGSIFVVVNVTLQNNGDKDMNLSGIYDFKLEDADGVQRSEALGGIGLNKLGSVSSLAPNGKVSADLIFEVPQTATSQMRLHYKPLLSFSSKQATIELQ